MGERSSEIWGMKYEKFSGKGEIRKVFHGVRKFFGNREKSETGGNASLSQGHRRRSFKAQEARASPEFKVVGPKH